MPSLISFTSSTPSKSSSGSIYTRPQKKQKMSITQTYFLAHSARGKLSKEASKSDHNLRLLVGHANMLDSLMIDLANAEQEQESWFNKSVSGAKAEESTQSQQWAETIVEEPEADWEVEDAENTDDESLYGDEEEDEEESKISESTVITTTEIEEEDEEEIYGELALTRTPSRHSPPELSADSDSDSEDEHMPASPPQPTFEAFTEKQRQAIATTSFYDKKDAALSPTEQEDLEQNGFYIPSREQPAMIAAF